MKTQNGDPEVINWRGIAIKAFYSTSRTCHYSGDDGLLRIGIKHLSKHEWSVSMSIHGLRTEEFGSCDELRDVLILLDTCCSGLYSLFKEGTRCLEELEMKVTLGDLVKSKERT